MKLYAARVGLLLALALTACNHNKNQVLPQQPLAPPIEDTPPSKPDSAPANLPPPVVTVPQPQQPATTQAQQPPPPPPKPKHHKPKPAQDTKPAQDNTEVAANNAPPEVFTPAEPADVRKQTSDSIAETEKGLNAITRKLSDQEQKTSAQIREFLKQAKAALSGGDVDGAHTLALKAKVLLGELTQ